MVFPKKKAAKGILLLCVCLLAVLLACAVYLGDFYRADMESIEAFLPAAAVEMRSDAKGHLLFEPEEARAGFVFYPGGKVEHAAYIPLMKSLASEGILCVLVKMPFHLAVLDIDAAAGIPEQYPQIEHWYIGGHSLGGSMAASYLSGQPDSFDGLILLGAYSTADLSESGLSVLSVYGSEDLVMNREKYGSSTENLPEDFTEILIEGGCHANFGMYGAQDGDGTPAISNEEQILRTSDAIAAMIRQPKS